MSAFETAQRTQAGTASDGNLLTHALHSALGVALLPARLAGSVWEAGWGTAASAVGASERTVSGLLGALVGAAWGAATGGTEVRLCCPRQGVKGGVAQTSPLLLPPPPLSGSSCTHRCSAARLPYPCPLAAALPDVAAQAAGPHTGTRAGHAAAAPAGWGRGWRRRCC